MKRFLSLLITLMLVMQCAAFAEGEFDGHAADTFAEEASAVISPVDDGATEQAPEITGEVPKADLDLRYVIELFPLDYDTLEPCTAVVVGKPIRIRISCRNLGIDDLSWSGSNPKVLSFGDPEWDETESTLVLHALKKGTSTIKVWYKGDSKVSASVKITVIDAPKLTGVRFAIGYEPLSELPLYTNDASYFGTPLIDMNTYLKLEPTELDPSSVSLTWKSSAPKVVSVDAKTGVITLLRYGKAKLTVTAKCGSVKKNASVAFTVCPEDQLDRVFFRQDGKEIKSAKIALDASDTDLSKDLVGYGNVREEELEYTWKSSKPAVAAVDPKTGVLTLKKEGTAKITVTVKQGKIKKTASLSLTVYDQYKPTRVSFACGKKTKLDLVYDDGFDFGAQTVIEAPNPHYGDLYQISYKSSKPAVASVDPATGVLSLNKKGTAKITVTVKYGKTKKTASCTVTVGAVNYDLFPIFGKDIYDVEKLIPGRYTWNGTTNRFTTRVDVSTSVGDFFLGIGPSMEDVVEVLVPTNTYSQISILGIGYETTGEEADAILKKKGWHLAKESELGYPQDEDHPIYLKSFGSSMRAIELTLGAGGYVLIVEYYAFVAG